MAHKKPIHFVKVGNKSYPYSLTVDKRKKLAHFLCEEANIEQKFALDEIPELLQLLPEHIREEQKYRVRQDSVLRFRVSGKEKLEIEKRAKEKGFKNISSYLRAVALAN